MSDSAVHLFRRKVTIASMAAVLASIAALVIAINYVNYRQTISRLHAAMNEIASSSVGERGGKRMALPKEGDRQEGEKPGAGNETGQTDGLGVGRESGEDELLAHRGGRQSAHTQYGSRFFFVTIDAQGNSTVMDKGNSELLDEEAVGYANRVMAGGSSEGMLDDYLYSVEDVDGTTRILFLDCTTEIQSLWQLLGISMAVGVGAFLIATGFVVRFSSFAVRPLEESARKQKQFVADAGHELKTPLSVIATNMDILEVDLADEPDKLEWIDSTNRQVQSMRDLVNDLISLSKMEEGEADLVFADVSLSDMADECVMTFEPVARSRGKALVASIDEGLCTRGDEPSIRQLLMILIDNAVKYAVGDGVVEVSLRSEGRDVIFSTRNEWLHNVDPRDLESLFDRFVRGDRSRDRSDGSNGYGLGLSIARAIAQKNHAKLNAREDSDGRIVFRATFAKR